MSISRRYGYGAILSVGLFTLVSILVGSGATRSLDTSILIFLHRYVPASLQQVVAVVTQFGRPEVLIPVGAALCAYLVRRSRGTSAGIVAILLAGTGLLTVVAKGFFDRPRPELWQRIVQESSFSFPSGHASTSMILALTALLLAWPRQRARTPILVTAVLYVVIIGLTRLYLGVHYPSDIVGGWLLASGWFCAVNYCYYRWLGR